MEAIKKVLIIRLGTIKDVIHSTQTYRSIKRKYPEIEIHYLTTSEPSLLLDEDSDLTKILTIKKADYKSIFKIAKYLRAENYDIVLNLEESFKMKLLSKLMFPKYIVNYKKQTELHKIENFFKTAQTFFKDIELSNKLSLTIPDETINNVMKLIPPANKLIAISTISNPHERNQTWNLNYFKELALQLAQKYDAKVLIIGSHEDKEKLTSFEHLNKNIFVYAGIFNILEKAAIFSQVNLLISTDNDDLHLASALNKPVCIGLYGPSSTKRTGIWGLGHYNVKSDLDCAPCKKHSCKLKKEGYAPCMDAIKVDEIMEIIEVNNLL